MDEVAKAPDRIGVQSPGRGRELFVGTGEGGLTEVYERRQLTPTPLSRLVVECMVYL